jgi:serpin B
MAYYDAEVTELNFNKPSALEYINSWGSLKTGGSFSQLIKKAPASPQDIFLINAFGIDTHWKQANYVYRSSSQFHLNNGLMQEVRTINWDGIDIRLSEQSDYSYFEIPFENDLVLLSVIQPAPSSELNAVMHELSLADLEYLRSSAAELKANVSLPEINFSTDRSIRQALSNIGLRDLFLSTTNLSPSFGYGNRRLSDINHLSKIETNSKLIGLQSSATFSNQQLMAVNVDHPFIYFVQDKHTNTVLFAGYYSNPLALK